jgi:hypothetical protein
MSFIEIGGSRLAKDKVKSFGIGGSSEIRDLEEQILTIRTSLASIDLILDTKAANALELSFRKVRKISRKTLDEINVLKLEREIQSLLSDGKEACFINVTTEDNSSHKEHGNFSDIFQKYLELHEFFEARGNSRR